MTGLDANTITAQHKAIETANKIKNLLEPFCMEVSRYHHDGLDANIACKWKSDMEPKTLKWAFKLAERNVSPFYRTGPIGWQPKVKQSDLNKNWARYLIAVDQKKQPIAYAMFRFDLDYGSSVLYCYELQVEKEYQRKGLGRFLMAALEKIARFHQMEKLVLTVLTNNENGLNFFKALGFATDDTSPDKSENTGYEILSKLLFV